MPGRPQLDRTSAAAGGGMANVLRALIDHAPVAMFVKDRDGRYLMANREFEAIFGVEERSLLGRSAYDLMPLELAEQVRANDAETLVRADPLRVEEVVPRDGTPHVYLSIKFALRDDAGAPWATCGVAIDMSEERLAREQAQRATAELERSNQELARFAAAASHDLSEPLRVINGYAKLLARRSDITLDELARGSLDQIMASAGRMQELIAAMLRMAQLRPHAAKREQVALDDVLASALADLAVSLRERNALVHAQPLPAVWGDPVQLRALFQNLLSNALKFTPPERTPAIDVAPQPAEPHWTIAVSDNGIGIDPRHAEDVFEPFRRLQASDDFPGTGLGLAMCRRIVELHGGRIWAEPNQPHGTQIRILLPARNAD
jgi:PAS domain S-box-containing protein